MFEKNKTNFNILAILILLFITSTSLVAQNTRVNSSYTRYGLGDISFGNYNKNFAMGSIGAAYNNPHVINYLNPASYAAFDSLSFLFDASLYMNQTEISTSTANFKTQYSSLGSITAGFPINKWCKVSFGLLPYSSVGYNMQSGKFKTTIDTIYNDMQNKFEGNGGYNLLYLGSGFKVFKNLYIGANVNYVYGSLNRINSRISNDTAYAYNVLKNYDARAKDIFVTLGIQYMHKLSSNNQLIFGLSYTPKRSLNADVENTTYLFRGSNFSYSDIKDTVIENNSNGKITFPSTIIGGVAFKHSNKIWTGIDFKMQKASEISIFEVKDSLKDAIQVAWGLEYVPKATSKNYFQKINYRVGARFNQTPYNLYETQVNEYGISFGLGLPLRKNKSTINLGFEFGERGKVEKGITKEKFYRIMLNISMHERWFVKSKYD